MRVALVVNLVTPDIEANLRDVVRMVGEAADAGAELVLFPEAAITGLVNDDDPEHDFPLAQPIPGPYTECLSDAARRYRVWVGIGILERDGDVLYDSAVLIAPDGGLRLSYRRNSPGWHGKRPDPAVYRQSEDVPAAETPFGRMVFLLCGDLFTDKVVARAKAADPDYLLFPFARSFSDGSHDQNRWDREEKPAYLARACLAGVPTLMTSYVAGPEVDDCIGGAMVASGDGVELASCPLGTPGLLFADV